MQSAAAAPPLSHSPPEGGLQLTQLPLLAPVRREELQVLVLTPPQLSTSIPQLLCQRRHLQTSNSHIYQVNSTLLTGFATQQGALEGHITTSNTCHQDVSCGKGACMVIMHIAQCFRTWLHVTACPSGCICAGMAAGHTVEDLGSLCRGRVGGVLQPLLPRAGPRLMGARRRPQATEATVRRRIPLIGVLQRGRRTP
jgi:hypothetical protein